MYGKRRLSKDKVLDNTIIGRIKKIPSLKEINPILYAKLLENKAVKMLIQGGKNMGDESE